MPSLANISCFRLNIHRYAAVLPSSSTLASYQTTSNRRISCVCEADLCCLFKKTWKRIGFGQETPGSISTGAAVARFNMFCLQVLKKYQSAYVLQITQVWNKLICQKFGRKKQSKSELPLQSNEEPRQNVSFWNKTIFSASSICNSLTFPVAFFTYPFVNH